MVGFTKAGAERIVEVVKYVERETRNPRQKRGRGAVSASLGFWAKITDGTNGKYSWEAMKPTDNDELESETDWGEGSHSDSTGYAIEARYQSSYVLNDSVVWMTPAKAEDYYVFDYSPGVRSAKIVSAATIPARSGSTPGDADVTLEDFDGTSFTDGDDVKVYNPFRSEIEGEAGGELYIEITYGDGGVWWVTGVDCKSTGGI